MTDADQTFQKVEEEAGCTSPVKTGDAGTKIQGAALIETAPMPETKKSTVGFTDENETVGLGHIQNQGNQLVKRVEQWNAPTNVREGRIGGAEAIRKMGVGGNARNTRVHYESGRAARCQHHTQLTDGRAT